MSAIDTQNAKQIRDPMDVLITLDLADDTVTCTFSDYGSAKVGDGRLNVPNWPMRKLADLQGEGFPLNGEHVLYDPSTTPSARNGKLGVRSNVGQSVSVTVTGNKVMASLTLFATGAESVTFNGTTTPYTGSSIVIPVGATSITLTFNPANETERIVISEIQPGTLFRITNENLIKATVSLRSDLSIIDPTLPESEINIEVYQDTDISEAVATIPEDTPITYRAGYPGDMSPERKFYVTGQVTWADNVLTIQGVDAVHFLDFTIRTPMYCYTVGTFYNFLANIIDDYVNLVSRERGTDITGGSSASIIRGGFSIRELAAFANNMLHQNHAGGALWITFVDAGRPSVRSRKLATQWNVDESDCGELKKHVDRKLTGIKQECYTVKEASKQVGTASWYKGEGAFLSFDDDGFGRNMFVGIYAGPGGGEDIRRKMLDTFGGYSSVDDTIPLLPMSDDGDSWGFMPYKTNAQRMTTSGMLSEDGAGFEANTYVTVIPWSCKYKPDGYWDNFTPSLTSQNSAWNSLVRAGMIDRDAGSVDLQIVGQGYDVTPYSAVTGELAATIELAETLWYGRAVAIFKDAPGSTVEIFPRGAHEALISRSPETASFTWKGDPRIQPRDVFTWHRLDGTDEEWTFENITLTHEGGGTMAEVTARKGIV